MSHGATCFSMYKGIAPTNLSPSDPLTLKPSNVLPWQVFKMYDCATCVHLHTQSIPSYSLFHNTREQRCLQQQFLYSSAQGLVKGCGCSTHSLFHKVQPGEVGLHMPQSVCGGRVICSSTPASIVHTEIKEE